MEREPSTAEKKLDELEDVFKEGTGAGRSPTKASQVFSMNGGAATGTSRRIRPSLMTREAELIGKKGVLLRSSQNDAMQSDEDFNKALLGWVVPAIHGYIEELD